MINKKKKNKNELEGDNSRTKGEVQVPDNNDDTNSLLPLVDKSYYIEEINYRIDNTNMTY